MMGLIRKKTAERLVAQAYASGHDRGRTSATYDYLPAWFLQSMDERYRTLMEEDGVGKDRSLDEYLGRILASLVDGVDGHTADMTSIADGGLFVCLLALKIHRLAEKDQASVTNFLDAGSELIDAERKRHL